MLENVVSTVRCIVVIGGPTQLMPMRTTLFFSRPNSLLITATALLALALGGIRSASAQSLTNDLVSHWPLDVVQGTRTPDVVSGYDMNLNNLTAADLVTGYVSNCFNFVRARSTLLSRVHAPTDDLPINKHPALTIVLWINAVGTGQNDYRFFSEANNGLSDPLFNLGTHSTGADGSVDIYIRQAGEEVAHQRTVGQPLDGTWHHFAWVQQADGTRVIYIDGVPDGLAVPSKRAGIVWNFNDTTIGGILRAAPSNWINGLIDEVAVWKRALSEAEINEVRLNGVPRIGTVVQPLAIRSFTADFATVALNDKVTLRWDASEDATLSISPDIGDVTASSQFGVGNIEATITSNTTFTLTATRGTETISTQAQVRVISGVAPNWRWIENFDLLTPGPVLGQGNFLNTEGVFSVVQTDTNRVLGYDGGDDLAAIRLQSLTVTEGQSNTLFFRVYIADNSSPIGITLGLTERPLRFNDDFDASVGPYIRLDGGAISARNGVGQAYTAAVDPLAAGKVYNVWIDVENRPFDVVGGVQMGGDRFSVHVAEEGVANRTTLFSDFGADRDAVNFEAVQGEPGTNLIYVFFSALVAGQGVNKVLFDDFYLSSGGFNNTVPVPASAFRIPLRITNLVFVPGTGFSFSWNTVPGKSYTVYRKLALGEAWDVFAPDLIASGSTLTHTDTEAPFTEQSFYQIIEGP